jgi:tripartite-type tricarboxylate transporter receptor subunit TctC
LLGVSARVLLAATAWATGLALTSEAIADSYPSRPIRLVVGYPPGGANDILARQLAASLGDTLKAQILVENRPGANAIIAADLVAKAPADGYTLLSGGLSSLVLNALTYAKVPYSPLTDFTGISTVASSPVLFAVGPGLKVASITELIAQARERPGQLDFVTVGTGGSTRLVFELFKSVAGIDVRFVPYKGAAPGITDLVAGRVHAMAVDYAALSAPVREGRLRAIGITSPARHAGMPEVPTMTEQGLPGMTLGNWYALLGPAKMPEALTRRLHEAVVAAVHSADFVKRLDSMGMQPMTSPAPAALSDYIRSEHERWAGVIATAGIKAE